MHGNVQLGALLDGGSLAPHSPTQQDERMNLQFARRKVLTTTIARLAPPPCALTERRRKPQVADSF